MMARIAPPPPPPAKPPPAGTAGMGAAKPKIICYRCMRWHEPPMCDHDATLSCLTCGRPRGYRFSGPKGELRGRAIECFQCWFTAQPPGSLT
jgi:hypothetical protein